MQKDVLNMKKHYLIVALCVVLLVCLLCPLMAGAKTADSNLKAGYASITIDPSDYEGPDTTGAHTKGIVGLPMAGYGGAASRLSQRTMADNGLEATCVALTDQHGKTVLILGVDLINSHTRWTVPATTAIVNAVAKSGYSVDTSDVLINASHTHSGPDFSYTADDIPGKKISLYQEWLYSQLTKVAVDALNGQTPVTMHKGELDVSKTLASQLSVSDGEPQTRMNYIRHYVSDDSKYVYGSNFGSSANSTVWTEVSEADDTMYLLQFTPTNGTDKPIVLVNWRAHATMNSTQQTTCGKANYFTVSADYVGALRSTLEGGDYRPVFIQGAAGNVAPNLPEGSNVYENYQDPDVLTEDTYKYINISKDGWSVTDTPVTKTTSSPTSSKYGQKLGNIALYGLENHMSNALDTSSIRTATTVFRYYTHVPTNAEQELITNIKKITSADDITDYSFTFFLGQHYEAYTAFRDSGKTLISFLVDKTNFGNYSDDFSTLSGLSYLKNIHSSYHLSNANSRMQYVSNAEDTMNVGAIAIGTELSMVVSPCELSDRYYNDATYSNVNDYNDWDSLESDTYGTPWVMGYTNGTNGYMPNMLSYDYNNGEGCYESQTSRFAQGTGEKMIDFYADLLAELNTTNVRLQCECGGTLKSGEKGHVCTEIEFLPWSNPNALPSSGNYYLTTDVVSNAQKTLSGSLRLDLNGHNITSKVSSVHGINAATYKQDSEGKYVTGSHNTRVFALSDNAFLSITDSTENPGTLRRDLSALTDEQKTYISNYGLIILLSGSTGDFVLYNGTLDAEGAHTGGGGVLANINVDQEDPSSITIYGGTLKGATANCTKNDAETGTVSSTSTSSGGIITNWGKLNIHGGTFIPYGYGDDTITNTASTGAVIYNSNQTAVATITGGTFYGGSAANGGVLYNAGGCELTISGGMIYGGSATRGGAVYNLGNLIVSGGTISGGTATTGGGCVYGTASSTFTMTGGTITGGVSDLGGAICISGTAKLTGGTVSGSRTTSNSDDCAGIYVSGASAKLTIGGTVQITDNYKNTSGTGAPTNIRFSSATNLANNFTIDGDFTGKASVFIDTNASKLSNGQVVGISKNASFTPENFWLDYLPDYVIVVDGTSLKLSNEYAAIVKEGGDIVAYTTLSEAIENALNGSVITLMKKNTEPNLVFPENVTVDLFGYDITGSITVTDTTYFMDSRTADYHTSITHADRYGYGKITGTINGTVKGVDQDKAEVTGDFYLPITNNNGTHLHRVNLNIVGATVRSDSLQKKTYHPGVYYNAQFGGDEVVRDYIKSNGAYGVALAANKRPDFAEGTYSELDTSKWKVGISADGYANNMVNGTLLTEILKSSNTFSVNKRNASTQINGQAYFRIGEEIIRGPMVSYSLKDLMEGNNGCKGANGLWDTLSDTQQSEMNTMFTKFDNVMQSWDIDNIKSHDDGVLKILMIGHSLGMDSTYFTPEVFKEESGQDVVIGTLYHSGCRLNQHVDYLTNNKKEYAYLEFDTSKDSTWRIWQNELGEAGKQNTFVPHTPNGSHDIYISSIFNNKPQPFKYAVTMDFGIEQHDWDIVVLQAGVFEAANYDDSNTYSPNITNDIKTIVNYVKRNDLNPGTTPKFAWNMTWAAPEDKELTNKTSYDTELANGFNNSSAAMHEAIANTLQDIVLKAYDFDYVFPSGTAVQNANVTLTDKQVYRDSIHGTDFTRLMVAYTWYCTLTGTDITDCDITTISDALEFGEDKTKYTNVRGDNQDFTLTNEQRHLLVECVNNAISNPYQVTSKVKNASDPLKVLVIGHSLGMDSSYLFPTVAKANGTDVIVGTLYHSGCQLSQHADFIQGNLQEYAYLEFDTTQQTTWNIWSNTENKFVQHTPEQGHDSYIGAAANTSGNPNTYGVTMDFAIGRHDWDIVIMMAGTAETTGEQIPGNVLSMTNLKMVRDHVLENDKNPATMPQFAWNMFWAYPETATTLQPNSELAQGVANSLTTYFAGSSLNMYNAIANTAQNTIMTAYHFDYLLPTGTTMQNAKANYAESDLYRDRVHATDYMRLMAGATWYCSITGKDVNDLTIPTTINNDLTHASSALTPSSQQLTHLKSAVGNAIANPYKVS